jgi:hypothetical protein
MGAIEESKVVIIIISNDAFSSPHMDAELLHAFECEKAILPLVKNMTFEDFQRQKPVWKFRLRGRVAKPLRISNRTETNADLISDLKTMGVHPSQGVQRSKDQILVRLRLLAPEEDLGEFVTLARSGKLDCSYRILDCNSSTFSAPNAAQIAMLPGGLFVIIREISRDALIELSLNSDGRSWKSHPLTVDAVPAQLFRGS